MMPRALIGCEESGVLANAFRASGFEAYSCDLKPTRGNPDHHFQMDIKACITEVGSWDLIILHPDCTAMAVSGNRWYGKNMPMHAKRIAQVDWTVDLWHLATSKCRHVALENPVSVIFPNLDAPVCYVQPYEHGHGETKKTGFALHGLPPITPTNNVPGREQRIWKMAPGPNRKRDRSETFTGIANAIVDQWGAFILREKAA